MTYKTVCKKIDIDEKWPNKLDDEINKLETEEYILSNVLAASYGSGTVFSAYFCVIMHKPS